MRIWLAAIVMVAGLVGLGNVAAADQCPGRIQQARAAVEQYKKGPGIPAIKDAAVAAADTNLKSAVGAHEAGEHDEAKRFVREALRAIGK
jgi:hypothetical protein